MDTDVWRQRLRELAEELAQGLPVETREINGTTGTRDELTAARAEAVGSLRRLAEPARA